MKSKNEKVQTFLSDLKFIDSEKFDTLIALRKIIFKSHGKAEEKFMYGGILFLLNDEALSGLFVRKNHVSIEFGKGFKLKDPNKLLEGNGKFRRHLKIKCKEDIKNKDVDFFVKQAV